MLALENIDNIIQKLFLLYVFFWDGQMDSFLRKILRRGTYMIFYKPVENGMWFLSIGCTKMMWWKTFSIFRCPCLWKWLWGLWVQCGDDRARGCSFGGVPRARPRVHCWQPASWNCVSFQSEGAEWRRGEYKVLMLLFLPSWESSALSSQPW